MADDENAFSDLAQYGIGAGSSIAANNQMQAAYQAMLQNLSDRFGDYSKLSPAQTQALVAQKLGPSALSGIAPDAQSREAQQAQLAQLDDIAKSGGLTLADKNALNQLEQTLGRSSAARNNSIANQFAARGQLGAGEQLGMQLANAQSATEQANQKGENVAADAQKRAMQAVLEKGTAARAMSNDDYQRKKNAADAADAIAMHNANFATDASKYNNSLQQQAFEDQLKKLAGETALTGETNQALLGSGKQNANTTAGLGYGGAGLLNRLTGGGGGPRGGGGSGSNPNGGGGSSGSDGGAIGNDGTSPGAGNSDTGATPAGGGSDTGTDGGAIGSDGVSPGAGDTGGDAWGSLFDEGDLES